MVILHRAKNIAAAAAATNLPAKISIVTKTANEAVAAVKIGTRVRKVAAAAILVAGLYFKITLFCVLYSKKVNAKSLTYIHNLVTAINIRQAVAVVTKASIIAAAVRISRLIAIKIRIETRTRIKSVPKKTKSVPTKTKSDPTKIKTVPTKIKNVPIKTSIYQVAVVRAKIAKTVTKTNPRRRRGTKIKINLPKTKIRQKTKIGTMKRIKAKNTRAGKSYINAKC